jgi:putative acetyltransferase
MITLRPYRPEDAPLLLDLFRDTIRRVNSRDYSPEQIAAWAADDIELEGWSRRFQGRYVVVAEKSGVPAGFTDLEPHGHVDRFFVSADHQRAGIGRAMLESLFAEGRRQRIRRLFLEASITARPFFAAHGFTTLARQVVTIRGVELVNYRMERGLDERSP